MPASCVRRRVVSGRQPPVSDQQSATRMRFLSNLLASALRSSVFHVSTMVLCDFLCQMHLRHATPVFCVNVHARMTAPCT